MRRLMSTIAVAVVVLSAVAARAQDGGKFVAPGIASASPIAYPMGSSSPGMVTLQVSLDGSGSVQNVQVVRDVPPLTNAAQSAVQGWTFTAATQNGNGVASSVRVNVVFNPFNPGGVALPSPGLGAAGNGGAAVYIPAQVTSASYATYPANSVASGTVVLDVKIGSVGGVKKVSVVQGVAALTGPATAAVRGWSFSAATRNGKPVVSHTVVVFVFASPAAGTQ